MTVMELYKKYVLDDIKYRGIMYHPVKAGMFSRIKKKHIDPTKLHPNPEDEFSMEKIGPNWQIINNYKKSIEYNMSVGLSIFDEQPLVVTKLDKGGYMLLNGHHRWFAAMALDIKKVPVQVVNITTEEDIYRVINKSKRDKCVSIDLDEVLLTDGVTIPVNSKIRFPFNKIITHNLRENSSLLLKELNHMGYDIWIYTGSYLSNRYIRTLLSLNKCKADGIVNGLNGKKKTVNLKEIFHNKYKTIVHINNEYISEVNTTTKEYDVKDLEQDSRKWAVSVIKLLTDGNGLSI